MSSAPEIPNLDSMVEAGVPAGALACYGRWWQLESWLREIVYVELRAKYGELWSEHLDGRAGRRADGEQRNRYMASADAGELLSYTDVGALFGLIAEHWPLFEGLLPPRRRWEGAAEELSELRNRNAHCRRPHRDDLARLEQTLRNLEAGAWEFYRSYLDTQPVIKCRDPVARAWVRGRHRDAGLLEHAERQYETRFRLGYSLRPWASAPNVNSLSGREGVVWYADWTIAGRELNVAELWRAIGEHGEDHRLVIHLLFDLASVRVTFAAIDDPGRIADEIGRIFEAILTSCRPFRHEEAEQWHERSFAGAELLPRCVQVQSALTGIDPLHRPGSIFGA